MFKIKINDNSTESIKQSKEDVDAEAENIDKSGNKTEKIETCYFCHQKFDMNKDDLSHYKYGKSMCDYAPTSMDSRGKQRLMKYHYK